MWPRLLTSACRTDNWQITCPLTWPINLQICSAPDNIHLAHITFFHDPEFSDVGSALLFSLRTSHLSICSPFLIGSQVQRCRIKTFGRNSILPSPRTQKSSKCQWMFLDREDRDCWPSPMATWRLSEWYSWSSPSRSIAHIRSPASEHFSR